MWRSSTNATCFQAASSQSGGPVEAALQQLPRRHPRRGLLFLRWQKRLDRQQAVYTVQRHIADGEALVHNDSQNGNLSSLFKSKMASRRPIHRGRHGENGTVAVNAAEREAAGEEAAAAGRRQRHADQLAARTNLVSAARTSGFATLRAPRDVFLACSLVREPGFMGRYSNSFTLQSEGPKSVPSQSLVLRVSLLITVVLDVNVLHVVRKDGSWWPGHPQSFRKKFYNGRAPTKVLQKKQAEIEILGNLHIPVYPSI